MTDVADRLVRDHRIVQLRAAGLSYEQIGTWRGVGPLSVGRIRHILVRETRLLIDLLPRDRRDGAALAEDRTKPSGVRRLLQDLGERAA